MCVLWWQTVQEYDPVHFIILSFVAVLFILPLHSSALCPLSIPPASFHLSHFSTFFASISSSLSIHSLISHSHPSFSLHFSCIRSLIPPSLLMVSYLLYVPPVPHILSISISPPLPIHIPLLFHLSTQGSLHSVTLHLLSVPLASVHLRVSLFLHFSSIHLLLISYPFT